MSNLAQLQKSSNDSDELETQNNMGDMRADQAGLLALMLDVSEATSEESALDALVGAVQHHFGCYQVAVALAEQGDLQLRALSKQAFIDASSSESKLLVDAMQEACDREVVIRWPIVSAKKRRDFGVLVAHRSLAGRRSSIAYCSFPIYHEQKLLGAMLLERQDGFVFSEDQGAFLEKVAVVVAPLLMLHVQADRGVLAVIREKSGAFMTSQLGTERLGRRLITVLVALMLLAAFLVPVESHIGATAELVPLERRLITVPRAGFVQSVDVVAGEQVDQGQLLATLDSRDLVLEASRSASEIATAEVEFRAAMASFDRQASAVARARLAQARAQQLLVERQLEQNSLKAPIAGIVLNTDPGNTLGAPVSRGDTLFEIAPADGYEVHLLVDESNIRDVFVGQTGELTLRARPDEVLAVNVQSVHPIAEVGDGASVFRVRATLLNNATASESILRPGESGQARLDAQTKSLGRILLDPLWMRLTQLKWRFLG